MLAGLITNIIREVYSKSIGTISISLIFTLLSADRGLFALAKELHLIYNFIDNKKKSWIYLKLVSLLKVIALIILTIMGLALMVFGSTIRTTAKEWFGMFENYTFFSKILTHSAYLLITFIVFMCVYMFMSSHSLKFKEHLRGAVFASIALNAVSYIFSKYLEIFRGFSTTYGSLTALMLIMMWTYWCFYVIFLGAEINKVYEIFKEKERKENKVE